MPQAAYEAAKRQFLASFGFTRRDVERIKAAAECCVTGKYEAALNDLDVPFRVGAVMQGESHRPNGDRLGEWAGCDLLVWKIEGRELEQWRQRPKRPRKV